MQNRALYFGDNLEILRDKFPDDKGYFDLIYLDPPFSSNRNYNVLFKEGKVDSSAQIHAFEDTWQWADTTIKLFEQLKQYPNPEIALMIDSLHGFLKDTPMMAYIVNMSARLIPLRRVLKDSGTLYLHCDPTASHYLKLVMDVIFGKQNFRNEIIWAYRGGGVPKNDFANRHDIILRYSKTKNYNFYVDSVRIPYSAESMERLKYTAKAFRGDRVYGNYQPNLLGKHPEDWWDIQPIMPSSKERLGYPTQKPEKLLDRIILASTKDGDWVLDPFCGCGTTVAVAERLKRNWVGIDISMQSINVIAQRMGAHYQGIKIHIDGIPKDFESAVAMAQEDKYAFQDWAITLVEANPPTGEPKKGADRGVDGLILFRENLDFDNKEPKLKKIIVQVKGGKHSRRDVATLQGDMGTEDAPMGIFICLNEPTAEMKRIANLAGEYKFSEAVSFPKIQILSVKDWFDGKKVQVPSSRVNVFKTAEARAFQASLGI